jgi:hypothetical protein
VDEAGVANFELTDLIPMKKFQNLQSLNLCSTYFPLSFPVELSDA